jgi:hypothetical protein
VKRSRGNRRSKILVEHDMIALVERMQLRNEDAKDAGKALGIPATTAQRLARKGLRRVLMAAAKEKIKAIADADSNPIPTMQGQFELPEPVDTNLTTEGVVGARAEQHHDTGHHVGDAHEDVRDVRRPEETTVSDPEFITLPDGTKRRIKPQQPTEDIYEWSHVMDYSSFRVKTPWRQAQLIAQWRENEVLGGKHVNLRGKPKSGPCFGSCPMGNCTCNVREDF